jgi:hypothetical protein
VLGPVREQIVDDDSVMACEFGRGVARGSGSTEGPRNVVPMEGREFQVDAECLTELLVIVGMGGPQRDALRIILFD